MHVWQGTVKKDIDVPAGTSATLTQFFTGADSRQYFGLSLSTGSGTYTLTLKTDYTYQCVVPYPNPFDISKHHTKITFAGTGVPLGKINIYTMDGKLIKTLQETAGSTKLEWNPLADNVPSGIYYYGAKNGTEKNMGSITIIR